MAPFNHKSHALCSCALSICSTRGHAMIYGKPATWLRILCRVRPHLLTYLFGRGNHTEGAIMKTKILAVATFVVVSLPFTAYAQGTFRGAEEGAAAGERAAGAGGAIVGGAVGAATGTVGGILGIEDRPRFRRDVIRDHRPSFPYRHDLRTRAV